MNQMAKFCDLIKNVRETLLATECPVRPACGLENQHSMRVKLGGMPTQEGWSTNGTLDIRKKIALFGSIAS